MMELKNLSFIQGYEDGKLLFNIPEADYLEACTYGKNSAIEFIQYLVITEFMGGDLQAIALGIDKQKENTHGFIVGFFSTLEQVIRDAVKPQQGAEK